MFAAISIDLNEVGSVLTTPTAAAIFWAIFVLAGGVAVFFLARRPRRKKRTATYDLPPNIERRPPPAERFRSRTPR